ncbi:MAG: bifunctional precorrin-2 dehydrogenase/sirohydrochlorin ferrochelatase [Methanomassiliicoccales archaeon]|jgi:siroheme synthase-like protein|nr:bifunctional precorrin-2 dehydrogenase/sirohydrochlorin ferrochelatase [Methanomassiliicoccales archaeon]
MLPLMIDLTGKKVVVFGGGDVGLRKARYFVKEAEVVVVSRDISIDLQDKDLRFVKEDIRSSLDRWIVWADYVIAATDDPTLNDTICTRAISMGKQFNRADGVGSFLIPSVIDRGNFVVAISTLGRSPAVSKALKEELEKLIDENWSLMVTLQEELRKEIRDKITDQKLRETVLRSIVQDKEILSMLGNDYQLAKRLALEKVNRGH